MNEQKSCFVIAPIGEIDSNTRIRSDLILKFLICPVAEDCGYAAVRADHISKPGLISPQVIECIAEADLVIADLTEGNPNVFYELAIRHAIRRPAIQLIEVGERIPFDLSAARTIQVDHKDLGSVDRAKSELRKQILAVERDDENVDNPISISLDLKALRISRDPGKRSIAGIGEEVVRLGEEVRTLVHNFSILDRLKLTEKVLETLSKFNSGIGSQFHDADDVMSKLDDISSEIGELDSKLSNIESRD